MTARNWLIAGVSSGFGRELATQLLDRGDTVTGTVRRPDSVAMLDPANGLALGDRVELSRDLMCGRSIARAMRRRVGTCCP